MSYCLAPTFAMSADALTMESFNPTAVRKVSPTTKSTGAVAAAHSGYIIASS